MIHNYQYNTVLKHVLALIILGSYAIFASCGGDESSDADEQMSPNENGNDPDGGMNPEPPDGNGNDPNGGMDPEPMLLPGLPKDIAGYNQWLKLNA